MNLFLMNKTLSRLAVVTVAAGATLALSSGAPANAANYNGSIAISIATGNTGASWDYPSRGEAEARALNECNAGDCQNVVWFQNGCGSVVQAPDTSWAWAYAPSAAGAESAALSRKPGARVIRTVCTSGHQ